MTVEREAGVVLIKQLRCECVGREESVPAVMMWEGVRSV